MQLFTQCKACGTITISKYVYNFLSTNPTIRIFSGLIFFLLLIFIIIIFIYLFFHCYLFLIYNLFFLISNFHFFLLLVLLLFFFLNKRVMVGCVEGGGVKKPISKYINNFLSTNPTTLFASSLVSEF